MGWVYQQSTGKLMLEGELVATGYSGHGAGKNNPEMQGVKMVGPIPVGRYKIGPLIQHMDGKGPLVMRLTPTGHDALGRSGFLIHGDNADHTASHGCIILPRLVRQRIGLSADRVLDVI